MSEWRVSVYVEKLRQQIETLRELRRQDEVELTKLRAELAAIRDAGDVEKERDEAIGLLKWLVAYPCSKSQLENIAAYDTKIPYEPAKRILELTAK